MMHYGTNILGVSKFVAKISNSNSASIHLFKDKLGFELISSSEVFNESTFELIVLKLKDPLVI
jgi:RimJ/RimL family protein N-acetyltransferase